MADIYIIYARENQDAARELYNLLSQRWDVWWDEDLVGDFAKVIEAEIPKSSCVVPLYSGYFRNKSTCTDELRNAVKNGKKILPIRLDDNEPPYSFGNHTYVDMFGWAGEDDHSGFRLLLKKLGNIVPPKLEPVRPSSIFSRTLNLPSLFMSVSSYETQLTPLEAIQALRIFGVQTILISAYDFAAERRTQKLITEVKKYRREGGFVLIDSGNYEASRSSDKSWSIEGLEEVLSIVPHDLVFCFDKMNPSKDKSKRIKEIIASVKRDQQFTSAPVLPIVHSPKLKEGGYDLENLAEIIRSISVTLEPAIIAVPERELGAGLISRAKKVREIRVELNKLPFYQPLHILGTGNPWAVPILTAAGADTFDGLEWCRMVIDRHNHRLNHIQYFEFYTDQTPDSPVAREALINSKIDFAGKVAFHNLDYYGGLMNDIRDYLNDSNLEALMVGLAGSEIIKKLKLTIPGLFK